MKFAYLQYHRNNFSNYFMYESTADRKCSTFNTGLWFPYGELIELL